MQRGAPPKAGFTLIELVIAVSLMAVVVGGVFMVFDSTESALQTGVTSGELTAQGRRAVDRMAELLSLSRRPSVLPAAPGGERPASTSRVDFPRVSDFDGVGAVWGNTERLSFEYAPGEVDDGVDNNGNGLIDEGRIVWVADLGLASERSVTLCSSVAEFFDGEVVDGFVDENGNGLVDERGLCFEFQDDMVTIRLSLQRDDGSGTVLIRNFERTVAFRQG